MKYKWTVFLFLFVSLPASASVDVDSIINKVKGYFGERLTRAYCMVKRDCHQRVIYVENVSKNTIQLNGCDFSSNKILGKGDQDYSAKKNSEGGNCTLDIMKDGKLNTRVNLTPRSHSIEYIQHQSADCLIEHRVLKSWKKCPWFCDSYKVMGYIGICIVGD